MTAAERPEAPPFLQTAAVGALMLAMAATPLVAARFALNPYSLLTLKWTAAAILVLPAAAVLLLGAPTLGRIRKGDGVVAAWFGLGVLATAGSFALAPAVTRLAEMTTLAAAYFIASRVSDRGLLRSGFAGVVIPVAAIVAAYSIGQHLGFNPLGLVSEGDDQLCASFVNRNLLAGFLAFAVVLGMEAIASTKRPETRAAAILAVTAMVAALVLSSTRGAWIGAGVALVLWLVRPGRRVLAATALALLLGVGLGAAVSHHEKASRGSAPGGHETSVQERLMMWRIGRDLLVDRPLLGWGPGNFDLASEGKKAPYFRMPERRGTYVVPRFAHNDAVELSTEMGIPGAVLWLCLIGALARRTWREWSSEGGAIALACVAVAVHGLFHWSLHDPVAALLFFAGLGAVAPAAAQTDPLRPWVARGIKLAVALGTAMTLVYLSRVLAARTLYERALAEQRAVQLHEALWSLRSACALDPSFPQAIAQRAVLLDGMGFTADALRVYQEASQVDPYDEGILLRIGILHARRGSLGAARQVLERAIAGNPNLLPAYQALAKVEELDGHAERAKALNEEAAKIPWGER